MRAVFTDNMDNLGPGLSCVISGDRAHHLIRSVRINPGEEILLMDGKGVVADAVISEVTKREVVVSVSSVRFVDKYTSIDALICLPKKDAFEEMVRSSVEMGVGNIIPCYSSFSQQEFKYNDRYDRIIESGVIQSNNPHGTIIKSPCSLDNLAAISNEYDQILYLSYIGGGKIPFIAKKSKILLIIGPEGGLSQDEEKFIATLPKTETLHINCPIMKAPTAFSVGVGVVLGVQQALE